MIAYTLHGSEEDAEFVCFRSVQPGTREFRVAYSGTTPAAADPAEVYPVRFVGEDSATF